MQKLFLCAKTRFLIDKRVKSVGLMKLINNNLIFSLPVVVYKTLVYHEVDGFVFLI